MTGSLAFTIRPRLRAASENEIEPLYAGALELLESVGVKVLDPEAFDLLRKAGGSPAGGCLMRLRARVVEQAVATAPKQVVIHDREGAPAMTLGGGNSGGANTYFGTGSDLKHTYDLSGELRTTVARDVGDAAKVVDALPNLSFAMSYGLPSDVEPEAVFRVEFLQMVANTAKPVVFTSANGDDSRRIIEMASAVAGGSKRLRERPFVINYAQPTSPLQHSGDAIGKLLACADSEVPLCYPPGLMPGATAPVTPAGAVTQSLAEALSGLAIHQARRPGAPVILCGAHGCMDMRSAVNVYAAPERLMTEAALASVYQHLGIPTWGFGGSSDALLLDAQAGAEFALLTMWAVLTGVNLAHDSGYLGSGMIGDLRAIVLNDELIGYVRRVLVDGLAVDDDTRALDALARVGPGGAFLTDPHTLRHFRSSLWFPKLSNRSDLNTWIRRGRKTIQDRLGERVRQILENHVPAPLPPGILARLQDMAGGTA